MPAAAAPAQRLSIALVATLALLVVPAAARADAGPVAVQGADVKTALGVAARHWGATPCGGAVDVRWTADPDPLLNATSTWSNPIGLWAAPERDTNCVVALNPNATWDWDKLCTVVAHEVGHLLGHQHTDAPGDLMNPVYGTPLPACAAVPEPEAVLTARVPAATAAPAGTDVVAAAAARAAAAATRAAVAAPAPTARRIRASRRHRVTHRTHRTARATG